MNKTEQAQKLYDSGLVAFNNEDYKTALANFEKAFDLGHIEASSKLSECTVTATNLSRTNKRLPNTTKKFAALNR